VAAPIERDVEGLGDPSTRIARARSRMRWPEAGPVPTCGTTAINLSAAVLDRIEDLVARCRAADRVDDGLLGS
jgi:hypothetical protein